MKNFISYLLGQKGVLIDEKCDFTDLLCSLQLIKLNKNKKNTDCVGNDNNENKNINISDNKKINNNENKNANNQDNKMEKAFIDNLYDNDKTVLSNDIDYTILQTKIHYEDFKYFISKIILSRCWIFRILKIPKVTDFSFSADQSSSSSSSIKMNETTLAIETELDRKVESQPKSPIRKSVNQMKIEAEQIMSLVRYVFNFS